MAGLSPITEASLGDGIFRAEAFLSAGGALGVGSDSNVLISLSEELRTLERNVYRTAAGMLSPIRKGRRAAFVRPCAPRRKSGARGQFEDLRPRLTSSHSMVG